MNQIQDQGNAARKVSLIVAVASNNVIGSDGDLPWRLSSDLKRFKSLTMGHHLIMGRKTYDSIGRPLPGRTTIVLTRQEDYQADEGVLQAGSIQEALELAGDDPEPFITGGAQIYQLALAANSPVTHIYRTRVHAEVPGDTFFPHLLDSQWQVIEATEHPAGDRDEYPHTFEILQRRDA